MKRYCEWLLPGCLGFVASTASAQLRIVDYNTASVTNPSAMTTVLAAMNVETVNGISKPIDALILQELSSGDIDTILSTMNGLGAGTYAKTTVGGTTGAGGVGLVYRTSTLAVLEQLQVIAPNTNGAERGVMRFKLRPAGYTSAADFYLYGSHYKASDGSANRAQRSQEAAALRLNSDALGQGAHIIYAGDFNVYNSGEAMWATLTGAGNGQAFDPLSRVGTWHDSASFKDVHTQNPAGSGFVGGGVDDRFDWQMVTGELMDNEGMSIIAGSYHAFGNNGTHAINGHINTGTGASPTVLNALGTASDHLPVVAQYQVPAKMSTTVSTVAPKVIVGAALQVTVNVSNVADDGVVVLTASGADELDYTINASGAASGSASGSDQAFGTTNSHAFTLTTASAGAKSATFSSSSSSPQVPVIPNAITRSYNVLDHANASFLPNVDSNSIEIDFGTLTQGSGLQSRPLIICNLNTQSGFVAGLDLDDILASGDSSALSIDLAKFINLQAGAGKIFNATLDTTLQGTFEAVYQLYVSDEDLPGSTVGMPLTLHLSGTVSAIPEPSGILMLTLTGGLLMFRRRSR